MNYRMNMKKVQFETLLIFLFLAVRFAIFADVILMIFQFISGGPTTKKTKIL